MLDEVPFKGWVKFRIFHHFARCIILKRFRRPDFNERIDIGSKACLD